MEGQHRMGSGLTAAVFQIIFTPLCIQVIALAVDNDD